MKIYKLLINNDDYAMVHVVEKNMRRSFYSVSAFKNINKVIQIEIICDQPLPLANISYFGGAFPICFDSFSYSIMKEKLKMFGIVKKALINDSNEIYYVFWPENIIDCLDDEKSVIETTTSGFKRLIKPFFLSEKAPESAIFQVEQFKLNNMFITEDISKILEESDITGYILEETNHGQ